MSPRLATAAMSAASLGFGWQGGGGCSALAPLRPKNNGNVSANAEQIPTDRTPFSACRCMMSPFNSVMDWAPHHQGKGKRVRILAHYHSAVSSFISGWNFTNWLSARNQKR